jgi:PhnB protein
MNVIPYLVFEGTTEEVMNFYAEIFGGEIVTIQRYSDGQGMEVPEDYKNKVLHGRLKIGKDLLYFSDAFPGQKVAAGNQISLSIEFDSEEKIDQAYEKLATDGNVKMPLQKTFWGAKYAKLTDQYGIGWDLNYQYDK